MLSQELEELAAPFYTAPGDLADPKLPTALRDELDIDEEVDE